MVRFNKWSLFKLDELVEGRCVSSWPEAAVFLISDDLKIREELFVRFSDKMCKIRKRSKNWMKSFKNQ